MPFESRRAVKLAHFVKKPKNPRRPRRLAQRGNMRGAAAAIKQASLASCLQGIAVYFDITLRVLQACYHLYDWKNAKK